MIFNKGTLTLVSMFLASSTLVSGECPNACSGHGFCGSFDMCTCDRNWQGPDCSQRTCPFGLAHVDTPKGDLNFDQLIGGIATIEEVLSGSTVYPYGTTEGFPRMEDTALQVLDDTAHAYAECSNKGTCDRSLGRCKCLPGYDGTACQRASCPSDNSSTSSTGTLVVGQETGLTSRSGSSAGKDYERTQTRQCSGHGTCETISELAWKDYENTYKLWDKDLTMGCKCDAGYSGPDCSERLCPYGIDPLYTDDTTVRVTQSTVRIKSDIASTLSGQYALKFFDVFGEDYITKPLDIDPTGVYNGVNVCDAAVAALKALPNRVVPDVECESWSALNTNEGFEYTLKFSSNPGYLRQMEIIEKLDGSRPTILTSSGAYSANVHQKLIGEFEDYFSTRCEGLKIKIIADTITDDTWTTDVRPGSLGYITGTLGALDAAEKKKLKACLGDSDYDPDNNVDVSNWDKGFVQESDEDGIYNMIGAFPHAIKVVPTEIYSGYDSYSEGKYHLVWFDSDLESVNKEFRVANLNSNANTLSEATEYYVYTTKGTVQQMGWGDESPLQITNNANAGVTASSIRITGYFDAYSNRVYTNYDTSCVNNPGSSASRNHKCVEKGDKLFIIDSCWGNTGVVRTSDGSARSNPFFGGPEIFGCNTSNDVNYNTGNLYTVKKVYTVPVTSDTSTTNPFSTVDATNFPLNKNVVNTFIIELDSNLGWEGVKGDPENANTQPLSTRDDNWSDNSGNVILFHFNPSTEGNYEYASMCSNRGSCDKDSGTCNCYRGYTGYDCSIQSILAK